MAADQENSLLKLAVRFVVDVVVRRQTFLQVLVAICLFAATQIVV